MPQLISKKSLEFVCLVPVYPAEGSEGAVLDALGLSMGWGLQDGGLTMDSK